MSSVFGGRDGTVERKYGEYRTGKRAPSSATIDEVEAKLPGTRPIIQNLLWPILHGETVPTNCLRALGDAPTDQLSATVTFERLELHLVAAALAKIDQSVDQLAFTVERLRNDAANLRYVPELAGDLEGFAGLWRERTEALAQDLATMRDAQLHETAVRRRALSPSGLYASVASRREPYLVISLLSLPAVVLATNASQVAVASIILVLSTICAFSPHARAWYSVDARA